MKKTKKIYRYVKRLVEVCFYCNGSGWSSYLGQQCTLCGGSRGEWKTVKELVGEEVIG